MCNIFAQFFIYYNFFFFSFSLQEVDHFDFLSRALATQSYSGIFVPKPDSPCVYIKDNNGPDGCAIFYKNDRFDLLEKHDKILQVWTVHSNQVKRNRAT